MSRFAGSDRVIRNVWMPLLLCGCGGGGGGSSRAVKGIAPAVTIDYPPTGCVTDSAVTARGTTAGIARVAAVSVNGFPATSPDSFRTWRAPTLVGAGDDTLIAEAARPDGTRVVSPPVAIRREPPLFGFGIGLVYDEDEDRVLFVDHDTFVILAFDRGSGEREVAVPAPTLEAGEGISVRGLALDLSRDRALVLELHFQAGGVTNRITSVDLVRTTRETLTSSTVGSGPTFGSASDLAYHRASDRLLVVDSVLDAVLLVDPVTGDREIVSDDTLGSGPALSNPRTIAFDSTGKQAFVIDSSLSAVVVVDLGSGDRKILSDSQTGSGPDFVSPGDVVLDAANGRLLVHDSFLEALVAVDLGDGDREIVVDSTSGVPLDSSALSFVVEPKGRLALVNRGHSLFEADLVANAGRDLFDPILVGEGQAFDGPGAAVHDPVTGDVLVVDGDPQLLIRIDPRTGDRSVASGGGVGSGPGFSLASFAAIDVGSRRVLVPSPFDGLIVAIDLATGDRSELSGPARGGGPPFETLSAIAIDPDRGRCFVVDEDQSTPGLDLRVIAVDLATGDRSIVSSAGRGVGPLPFLADLDYDRSRDALVCTTFDASLLRIDVASGDRTVLTDATVDPGPTIVRPAAVSIGPDGRRAFVADSLGGSFFAIVAVDLATGQRSVVCDCNGGAVGFGPLFTFASKFGIDRSRGIAYGFENTYRSIVAIDLETGDRVIRSR